ncbi:capsid protein [Crucivirus-506]|nr:capsid protein [Crucivirus-505]QMW68988.1 capsid protein [Crucivirus-506]
MVVRRKGYRYAKRANGTKYRVYGKSGKRKTGKRSFRSRVRGRSGGYDGAGDTIMGYGRYSKGRRRTVLANSPPTVRNSSHGVIMRHREFITDVVSTQAFGGVALSINPGLPQCFPWLANIAENFEEWVPRGIIFEFKTTSSDAVVSTSANAGLGTVIMATEYNPYNGYFGSKQQMENYEGAKSCKPSQTMYHAVECSKTQNPMSSYFVRTGTLSSNQDARMYDIGLFQIATQGMQSTGTVIGELWVTYEVEMRKPRIQVGVAGSLDADANFDHFQIFNGNKLTVGVLPATPFGTAVTPLLPTTASTLGGILCGGICPANSFTNSQFTPTKQNFIGGINQPDGTKGPSTASTYYFPPGATGGVFMIQYTAVYSTAGAGTPATVTPTNCTPYNLFNNNTMARQGESPAGNTNSTVSTMYLQVTSGNAKFTVTAGAGPSVPIWADMMVAQIPSVAN